MTLAHRRRGADWRPIGFALARCSGDRLLHTCRRYRSPPLRRRPGLYGGDLPRVVCAVCALDRLAPRRGIEDGAAAALASRPRRWGLHHSCPIRFFTVGGTMTRGPIAPVAALREVLDPVRHGARTDRASRAPRCRQIGGRTSHSGGCRDLAAGVRLRQADRGPGIVRLKHVPEWWLTCTVETGE